MRPVFFLVALLSLLATSLRLPAQDAPDGAVRIWKDSTGNFELKATFVAKEGSHVLLKKSDGKVLKLALDKLSEEDQAEVERLAEQPPGDPAKAAVNPFETAEIVKLGRRARALRSVTEADRQADYSQMRSIAWQPTAGKALVPDAQAPSEGLAAGKAIFLAGEGQPAKREDFFESPKSVHITDKGEAIVIFVNAPPGADREVRVVRCDLAAGRFLGEMIQPMSGTPVDISPSGQLLACLPDRFTPHGEQPMIEILRLNDGKLLPVRCWNMGDDSHWGKRFEQLHFIGEDKLLATTAWGGNAVLWDIDQARALWQLKFAGHHTPAISANRKQLAAVLEGGGIGIFDTTSGDTLARFDAQVDSGSLLAFSADGQRLACVTPRQARAWDLTTGKLIHEMWFPKQMQARSLAWTSGEQLLVDHSYLIDLPKRIVLWQYELPRPKHETIATLAGGLCWVLGGSGNVPYQLTSFAIPDSPAEKRAQSLSEDEVLAIKPGAAVQIKISVPGATPEEVQQVTKALIQEVRGNGLRLVPDAPITIECSIADAGEEKVSYERFGFGPFGAFGEIPGVGPFGRPLGGHFGRPFGGTFGRGGPIDETGDEATVKKRLSVISIKENGKELWIASGHYGAPFHLRQKEGQSIQDAVNEQRGNPIQFFLQAELPKYVARHGEDGTYGKSKLGK
jgi:hypothetical protein